MLHISPVRFDKSIEAASTIVLSHNTTQDKPEEEVILIKEQPQPPPPIVSEPPFQNQRHMRKLRLKNFEYAPFIASSHQSGRKSIVINIAKDVALVNNESEETNKLVSEGIKQISQRQDKIQNIRN